MAGHKIAGAGQLILACCGFFLVMAWFAKTMISYYNLISDNGSVGSAPGALGAIGGVCFALSWLWAAFTSIYIAREPRPFPQ
jgi:hypothetical protein